jgi:hypothetical protein
MEHCGIPRNSSFGIPQNSADLMPIPKAVQKYESKKIPVGFHTVEIP